MNKLDGRVNLRAVLAMAFALCTLGAAEPAIPPDPVNLKPGQFLWRPEIAPEGPVVLVVSLDEQRAYVYRNGVAIGVSTISSGKKGHETPSGVFTILQKRVEHYSNLYNNAPMPFMQRLTWDGVALHAGSLPGYPASHGCVRLPKAFAEKVFSVTKTGDTVVVASGASSATSLVHPAVLAPVMPVKAGALPSGDAAQVADWLSLEAGLDWHWNDYLAPQGAVSVIASLADGRVHVLRNGVRIGEAALSVDADFVLNGSVLLVKSAEPLEPMESPQDLWQFFPILGQDSQSLALLQLRLQHSQPLHLPEDFARRLRAAMADGATILLTDLPAVREPGAGDDPGEAVLESGDD